MSPISPMSFGADVRVVCYLLSILAASASDGPARDCNISTTVSCVLYEDTACFARIRSINEMQQRTLPSWPGSPESLQVEPFKAAPPTGGNVGLSVQWLSPSTSARFVKGYRLQVASASGGGQHSTCRFLEISRQRGKSLENEQFVYHLGISNLTSQPQWTVGVESIPSCPYWPWSSTTAFVTIYDNFMEDTPLASARRYWKTSYITAATTPTAQPDVAVRFAPAPSSLGFTSYTVALWRCDSDNRQHCGVNFGLTLRARATVRQPNNTTTFYSMQAGLYLVSVEADNVGNICGTYISCQKRRSQLFSAGVFSPTSTAQPLATCYTDTTGQSLSSSFLVAASSQTDSHREPLVSSEPSQHEPIRASSPPFTSESKFSAAPQEIKSSGLGDWKITFLSVAGAVLVLLILIASITAFCLRRKKQHKGLNHFKDSPVRYDPVRSCPDQSMLLPRSTIFLVSHSENRRHTDVTDALATYLEAFCLCDVIYYRWHLDEVQRVGPEDWVNRHIENADWVAFVHTHDLEQKFLEWRTARKKSAGDTDLLTDRMLAQVFDDVGRNPEKCLNVTFFSSGLFAASFWPSVSSVRSRKHVSQSLGAIMPPERVCHDSIFENNDHHWNAMGIESEVTEEFVLSEMEVRQLHEAAKVSPRVYRLMNDFSAFLADIHKLKPGAVALKSRGLPADADHFSTQEGRTLYRSVAVLRSNLAAAYRDVSSCNTKYTCAAMNTTRDADQGERIDSGFDDDYSPSFISPEELSPEDMGMTSVDEVLHALNARSEWEGNGSIPAPDCYSLGWRDV